MCKCYGLWYKHWLKYKDTSMHWFWYCKSHKPDITYSWNNSRVMNIQVQLRDETRTRNSSKYYEIQFPAKKRHYFTILPKYIYYKWSIYNSVIYICVWNWYLRYWTEGLHLELSNHTFLDTAHVYRLSQDWYCKLVNYVSHLKNLHS